MISKESYTEQLFGKRMSKPDCKRGLVSLLFRIACGRFKNAKGEVLTLERWTSHPSFVLYKNTMGERSISRRSIFDSYLASYGAYGSPKELVQKIHDFVYKEL